MFEYIQLWRRRLTDTFSFLPPKQRASKVDGATVSNGSMEKMFFFVTNSSVVCSKHFRKEDVRKTLRGRWFLVSDAEPSQFSWTEETPKRKPPPNRERAPTPKSSKTTADVETVELYVETVASDCDAQATPEAAENFPPVDPQVDTVQALLDRIGLLEKKVSSYEEKIAQLGKKKAVLLEHQFSLDKIKDDNTAILFYTDFPNYEALMSFYYFVEPKLHKMQYWKGNLKGIVFVVYFGEGMPLFKENISLDSSRWSQELLPRLEYFFKMALFPEILTKRVERGKLLYLHGGWLPYGQYSCTVNGLKLRFNRAQ